MKKTLAVLLSVLYLGSTLSDADGTKKLPNQWSCYYKLYEDAPEMANFVAEALHDNHLNETQCLGPSRLVTLTIKKWYEHLADEDRVLVKYSCSNLEDGQYEYLDFNKSSSEVFMFGTSLEDFGLQPDNQKFEEEVPEEEGKKLIKSFLAELKDKIEDESTNEQFLSYHIDSEPCIGPGTETLYHMKQKVENGLTYYSFTISCRVHEHSLYPSYFTSVEIAIDEYSGNFKNGLPELVHVGKLRSNEMYITKMELESTLSEWNKFSSLGIVPGVVYNPLTERTKVIMRSLITDDSQFVSDDHRLENSTAIVEGGMKTNINPN